MYQQIQYEKETAKLLSCSEIFRRSKFQGCRDLCNLILLLWEILKKKI